MRRSIQALVFLVPLQLAAQSLEVRVAPADRVYLHEVHRGAAVHDLVIQNVALINRGPGSLRLRAVRFELLRRQTVVSATYLPQEILEPMWRLLRGYLDRPGVMTSQRSVFLFDQLLPGGTTLAATLDLGAAQAIVIGRRPFVTSLIVPDRVRISATAVADGGNEVLASAELDVVRHASPNAYQFPVEGRWYVASSGSLQSHHRWRPSSEFALDLTRIGEGARSYRGGGTGPSDYLAYGQRVVAAAAGRVVDVRGDVPDNDLPRAGETRQAFAQRVLTRLWEKDPSGVLASGNLIVIQHAGGEYSSYAHLRAGSIRVAVGDSVGAGQPIAQVGFSGDGFEPHLHFQITLGGDPHFSPGLPLVFTNIRPVAFSSTIDEEPRRHLLTGEFVETITAKR